MNKTKWCATFALAALAAAALIVPGCKKTTAPSEPAEEAVVTTEEEQVVPAEPKYAFTLPDESGKDVSLSDHQGKIVVLEWINPECPFVQRHYTAGTMANLARKYAPRGVAWLAINTTHTWNQEKNKAFRDGKNLPYPILDDSGGQVGHKFGAKTTPHMFILHKDGKLAYAGAIDDDPTGQKAQEATNYVAQALDELLADKAVTTPQTKPYGCSVKYAPQEP